MHVFTHETVKAIDQARRARLLGLHRHSRDRRVERARRSDLGSSHRAPELLGIPIPTSRPDFGIS